MEKFTYYFCYHTIKFINDPSYHRSPLCIPAGCCACDGNQNIQHLVFNAKVRGKRYRRGKRHFRFCHCFQENFEQHVHRGCNYEQIA